MREKRKCRVFKKMLFVLGIILLLFIIKNIFYVQKYGVIKGVYEDEFQRKYVKYNGDRYYEYRQELYALYSSASMGCEPIDKVGFSVKSILDYIILVPEIVRYSFWTVEYDSDREYLLHLGMHADSRLLYVREDIVNKLRKNKVIMTLDEYEYNNYKNNPYADYKEWYTEEELNTYVLNDSCGDIMTVCKENRGTLYITNTSDIDILKKISCNTEDRVSLNRDILSNGSYMIRYYKNELPVPKLGDYIVVINGKYIYVKLDENNKDNSVVKGTIIEDERAIQSIKLDGVQVFTKENGVTINDFNI